MIELLDFHGSDNAIANSARVSFADFGVWNEIPENYSVERRNKLIKYLANHKHLTPFRHTSLSIRCKAPIFIARQLGKHQAGLSWNEVSRRYVKSNVKFFIPEKWRAAPEGSIKQGSAGTHPDNDNIKLGYDHFIEHCEEFYNKLLSDGVAPEMARMVLPQSMMTEWVWTGNLLAMAHIYKERIAPGAQEEVREFAKKLDSVIRPLFPISWSALVD
ncbi:thymidylate synthase [Vibrio phage Thalassa]|uniref:Thymidylate synthase n=1 Tax=Vibrio phage Thalassa TaxID=2570301 RepID=A0A2H5BH92_9CAUD|nr:thymidylate synthase [Vibrio phage Thalassa]AUG85365.1 thymidylate synthase [Vibrio phage Thalassa]